VERCERCAGRKDDLDIRNDEVVGSVTSEQLQLQPSDGHSRPSLVEGRMRFDQRSVNPAEPNLLSQLESDGVVHDGVLDGVERGLSDSDSHQPLGAGSERRWDEGEVDRPERLERVGGEKVPKDD